MTKTKYVNPKKEESKILTKTFRKKPLLSKSDSYYVHIPDNYMDNKDFPEDAEIKTTFINNIIANGVLKKKLNAGQLNGICKEQHAITQNLKMQASGRMILYIEKNGDVKAAITIRLDFYTSEDVFDEDEEEEEDEEEIPWRISQINILTFCSKEPGYGKKLMNKIINLFYVGIDNGYILEDAKIVLNYTASSKPFYIKLGFDCTDTHNELCYFDGNMIVPKKYRAGRKTKRNTKRGKTTRRQRRSNK